MNVKNVDRYKKWGKELSLGLSLFLSLTKVVMAANNVRVLSIQSHVVSGYVGNKSACFPLQVSCTFGYMMIMALWFCYYYYHHFLNALSEILVICRIFIYTHIYVGILFFKQALYCFCIMKSLLPTSSYYNHILVSISDLLLMIWSLSKSYYSH